MPKNYETEREGQIAFFHNFRIDYENNSVLIDNTDGVWKGNILEFKLNVSNLNKVVFQTIKYLSKMRIKGESVPANILIVDLNQEICYLYHSQDYFDDIHKVYMGGASTNNENFVAKGYDEKIDYSTQEGSFRILQLLQENNFMKIKIDENCVVGWSERYYNENPTAKKGDFLGDDTGKVKIVGEIREPKHFKDYILPFNDTTNERFKFLMDVLNDKIGKKDLGAFYTPMPYAKKACELVKMAINRVPEDNDYIILDRCCGTGNLEQAIIDELGDDVATHIVCSTYEYYEYKVLIERLGDKVRAVIPPTEENIIYDKGCVLNADALSKDYINNPIIKSYIDNPKCSIILFENPPYRDMSSGMTGIKSKGKKKTSFVLDEMIKDKISATNEMANHFIWSGFKHYLRQQTDSYILFSPMKYWKIDNLANYKIVDGFIFNKVHFHAKSSSAIGCIYFSNLKDETTKSVSLKVYDIDKNSNIVYLKNQTVNKVKNPISEIFDKTTKEDDVKTKLCCSTNGNLAMSSEEKYLFNQDIVGYIVGRGFGISNPNLNFNLVRLAFYDKHGFYLRKETYKKYLPILAIKHYLMFERQWYETELVCCSTDKGKEYLDDEDFIKSCFIFSILDYYNKTLSLSLPDNSVLKNELCFDEGTVASADLLKYNLNSDEEKIINLWKQILEFTKGCKEYDANKSYGVYQISQEINISSKNSNGDTVYTYPELNGHLNTLKTKLQEYHLKYITPKLLKYELIK